ncbi:uncharacterized protein LOC109791388 [Cajanus cajan]|uniref:uncharacterized protein LOC109791388 n=1 Tax=Cajanus cajan TaxID=3821 RepID=UPI00098D8849|nr:uncharacterized protein LOC109791388 [Cajanus cajan]
MLTCAICMPTHAIEGQETFRRHPFVDGIMETPLPRGWKPLHLDRYDGTTDPDEHIDLYTTQLALPQFLSNMDNVFHVSQLRKYVCNPSHVVEYDVLQIKENLTYKKKLVVMVDHKVELRSKSINLVKVVWDVAIGEAIWQLGDRIKD